MPTPALTPDTPLDYTTMPPPEPEEGAVVPAPNDSIEMMHQVLGESFPWDEYLLTVPSAPQVSLNSEKGRQQMAGYQRGLADFLSQSSLPEHLTKTIEQARAAGNEREAQAAQDALQRFHLEAQASRWASDSLNQDQATWSQLPEDSRQYLQQVIEGGQLPDPRAWQEERAQEREKAVKPPPPVPMVAMPRSTGREDQTMSVLRLTALNDPHIQKRGRDVARSARQAMGNYGPLIQAAAARHGVDELLMAAQIGAESAGNPNANSPYAVGLTQFIVPTWNGIMQGLGRNDALVGPEFKAPQGYAGEVDPWGYMLDAQNDPRRNPTLSVEAQAAYLAQLARTHNGDMAAAITEYNAGPNSLRKAYRIHRRDEGLPYSGIARELMPESKNYYPQILAAWVDLNTEREASRSTTVAERE